LIYFSQFVVNILTILSLRFSRFDDSASSFLIRLLSLSLSLALLYCLLLATFSQAFVVVSGVCRLAKLLNISHRLTRQAMSTPENPVKHFDALLDLLRAPFPSPSPFFLSHHLMFYLTAPPTWPYTNQLISNLSIL